VLYTHIVFLIHLYTSTGRNAPNAGAKDSSGIELESPTGRWYSRVPSAPQRGTRREPVVNAASMGGTHVIGDDEYDE